jgi:ParB family transcriptional regulator, chromosome partitioning protein
MSGKKKLCDVSVRSGVVGLRFAGKEGGSKAAEWGEKIAAFIRAELAKDSSSSKLDEQ